MKNSKLLRCTLTASVLVVIFLSNALSQMKTGGEVAEVIDGRTVVVTTQTGRITVELQHIEVPEVDQPLHAVVKDHLKRLLLGKTVAIHALGLSQGKTPSLLFLNGIDVSLQLLRDGAAWHVPAEISGQNKVDFDQYAESEALARQEKRGVWSIPNLKPAWEFRSTRSASQQVPAEVAASQSPPDSPKYVKNYKYRPNPDMWIEVGGPPLTQKMAIGDGLFSGYDYSKQIANISTTGITPTVSNGQESLEVEIRFVYFYRDQKLGRESEQFVMGVRAKSKKHNFSDSVPLIFICDGKQIDFGNGSRHWRETDKEVEELLQHRVTRDHYAAVAAAKTVTIKVGSFTGNLSYESRGYLRKLVAVKAK